LARKPYLRADHFKGGGSALGEGISTGHATMPEFKFEPKQVDEIIDYLKTLERQ
jgi:mono/diheme cytochrome c family protein